MIIGEANPANFTDEVKASIQEYNDVGIIVLRRNVGEGFDLWSGEEAQPIYQEGSGTEGWGDPIYGQSYPLLTQVLRNEWGFEGCVITDMAVALLTYYHAPEAVKAGTDYFDTTDRTLYGGYFTEEELEKDPVLHAHAALRQAAHRILYTFVNSNAMNGTSKNAELITVRVFGGMPS